MSLARIGIASLLGAFASFVASPASADTAAKCDPTSLTCSVGSASLKGTIKNKIASDIDSGWMDKGNIKIRTHFTIDPVGQDPLVAVDMSKGALVQAAWPEKGFIELRAVTDAGAQGTMNVHYTLTPRIEANIYGISLDYDADSLLNLMHGASFHYDSQSSGTLAPWGFAGGAVTMPAPAIDQSTIFSLGFADLGVDPGIVEGSLAIQASAKPIFKYQTKEIRIDSGSITAADGVAKIAAVDQDAMDVQAYITGDITIDGSLDVKPVIQIDSVDGFPTFGLTKFSFSVLSKSLAGMPATNVSFEQVKLHIPLPNVKVPTDGIDMGKVDTGQKTEKSVTIQNTGEMDSMLTFSSSDPQFTVPSDGVRVSSKGQYELKVGFAPTGGAASATITVKSNDPDSPEQTFRVAANGASLDPSKDGKSGSNGEATTDPQGVSSSGCSTAPGRSSSGAALALVAVALIAARRRRSR
jgi:MYXO-CTERM domain-containing protein